MQQLTQRTFLTGATGTGAGPSIEFLHAEDCVVIMPVTSGGAASMTMVVEALNPDGNNWHQVATPAVYSTVGAQTAIIVWPVPGRAVRVRVSAYTNGTLDVKGYTATTERD